MNLRAYLDQTLDRSPPRGTTVRAVGMLGANIPVELILAAGALPVQLGSDGRAGRDFALADRFLESSFSQHSRNVAQQWLSGALDGLEAVIFSRSDDSAQRLYYYVCELQRMNECGGPKALLYDVARISRGSSEAHTIQSTQLLASALGTQEAQLPAATQRVSERAELSMKLAQLRASDAVPPGSLAHRIVRAAALDWSEQFENSLRPWLLAPQTAKPGKRIVLVGSVPTDERLHATVEAADAVVVAEINESPPPAASAPTIDGIARKVYRQTRAAGALLRSPVEILRLARELRSDGVIVWMLATDTGLAWEAPRIERAMNEARVPTLVLTSQPDAWDEAALAQVQQFVRGVKA